MSTEDDKRSSPSMYRTHSLAHSYRSGRVKTAHVPPWLVGKPRLPSDPRQHGGTACHRIAEEAVLCRDTPPDLPAEVVPDSGDFKGPTFGALP
ncbi:hypothetical protein GWI33_015520 [Rhynchophorus ferrugineus]|uniref:Uncharacterized protein n=1 Tax=Rhynchophorus ferrugineus TaxID=354439 RepID=A0A834I2D2_RHYFE|nr:hypothetical protein GWI33_015520 [Rhynchophorus ferrugineus]